MATEDTAAEEAARTGDASHALADTAAAAHGDAAHQMADSAGMPQLDFTSWPNQIFWLLVALAAIYFVLSRIALPRISAVLAEK